MKMKTICTVIVLMSLMILIREGPVAFALIALMCVCIPAAAVLPVWLVFYVMISIEKRSMKKAWDTVSLLDIMKEVWEN